MATAATLLAIVGSALAFGRIDPGAGIAVHWGINGAPDRFAGRLEAVVLLPLMMAALTAALFYLSRTSKGRKARAENASAWLAGWSSGLAIALAAHLTILRNALTGATGFDTLAPVFLVVSLALIAMGNTLPKTRPNPYVGVRTPSTMADRGAWGRSNRFAGWTLVLTGVAALLLIAAGNLALAVQLIIAGTVLGGLIAVLVGRLTRR